MITNLTFKMLDKKDFDYKNLALSLKDRNVYFKNQVVGFIKEIIEKEDGLYGIVQMTESISIPGLEI